MEVIYALCSLYVDLDRNLKHWTQPFLFPKFSEHLETTNPPLYISYFYKYIYIFYGSNCLVTQSLAIYKNLVIDIDT